jgi:CobQ-like glutamine amidotransferase family enzyme
MIYLGGGADFEQQLLADDLLGLRDNIKAAYAKGVYFLMICGGYQLMGQYYKDSNGKKIPGLGLFDYYTVASTNKRERCIGNIVVETQLDDKSYKVIGFENHGGQTKNVSTPFARVLNGHGNMYQSPYEGFMNDTVLATYMHGPLLPKNPKIADALIRRALKKRYGEVTLEPLDDTLENRAREVMLERLHAL